MAERRATVWECDNCGAIVNEDPLAEGWPISGCTGTVTQAKGDLPWFACKPTCIRKAVLAALRSALS
jgi:hypothetical protein